MRLEARPIEFTNGCANFYSKKKVDSVKYFGLQLSCIRLGLLARQSKNLANEQNQY